MERFDFKGNDSRQKYLQPKFEEYEKQGLNQREALIQLLAFINSEIEGFAVTYRNTLDYSNLMGAKNEVELAIRQVEWLNEYGYLPRIRQEDFDFDDTLKRAQKFGNRRLQINYLEQVLLEYRAFADGYIGRMQYKFGERIEAEIKTLKMEIELEKRPDGRKLVWHGKPAEFGYFFMELQSKGWIGLQQGGEMVYAEFARVCMELFEFKPQTSPENLAKELNPNSNSLTDDPRSRLRIPFPNEMNPPKSKKPKEKSR